MQRSDAFQIVCERNALRRQSGLPLLPVRATVDAELKRAQLRSFAAAAERYRFIYAEMRATIIRKGQTQFGQNYGGSLSGRWKVDHEAWPQFERFLEGMGYQRPSAGVVYGKDRSITEELCSS